MKKIILISIALFAIIANGNAQVLPVLLHEGAEVASGAEFNVAESSILGWHQIELTVKNNSTVEGTYKVKKTIISEVEGSSNYFCFGVCFTDPQIMTSPDVTIQPNETLLFSGDYEQAIGVDGITTIRYDFYNITDPRSTIYVVVNYLNGNASGVDNSVAGNYFNVITENGKTQFVYNLEQNCSLFVYSASGQLVATQQIEAGASKTAIADNLQKGVYAYALQGNNKILKTGKFISK
jgi:hypothetical protein